MEFRGSQGMCHAVDLLLNLSRLITEPNPSISGQPMSATANISLPSSPASPSLALDTNLGFPIHDPAWQSFLEVEHCGYASFVDLDRLTAGLKQHQFAAAYLPTANAYFLRDDPTYSGIASALSGASGSSSLSSMLVVKRSSPIKDVAGLKGKRLGRINAYCTTSYFAPAIFLHRSGYSIHDFFGAIIDVGAWQKQIDAVMAGVVDATMVDADTWNGLPANADNTRVLGLVDRLPTPVVIAREPAAFADSLRRALLAEKRNPQALFSGFTPFQQAEVEAFFRDVEAAFAPLA
jgi:hypothetical protein